MVFFEDRKGSLKSWISMGVRGIFLAPAVEPIHLKAGAFFALRAG